MENNNVSYELLAMSNSDSLSDPPRSLSVTRKKKFRRKSKTVKSTSLVRPKVTCSRNRLITISFLSVILLCWLFTLTWIAVALHIQTSHLESTVQGVAAGSQGVPDAIQKCHSLSRELQNNQTKLFTQLATLSQHLSNFTSQIGMVQGGLANVEEKLMASPELVNVPHDLQALSESVARFGSQIQDLQATSNNLKDEHAKILETLNNLQKNISGINKVVYEYSNATRNGNQSNRNNDIQEAEKKLESLVQDLRANMSTINATLSRSLHYVQDDQHQDHKAIETLKEVDENVSSQLKTIQHEMSIQQQNFTDIEKQCAETSHEVSIFKTHAIEAKKQCGSLLERWKKLENSTKNIGDELALLKASHEPVVEQNTTLYSHHNADTNNTASIDHLNILSVGNTTLN